MTSVYLAARFDQRARLVNEVVRPLVAAGHVVTSNWMELPPGTPALTQEELAGRESVGVEYGIACRTDVYRAEALAVFTDHPSTAGGYHVEFGMAMALGKALHVIGTAANIFYTVPGVVRHDDIAAFLKAWGCTPT